MHYFKACGKCQGDLYLEEGFYGLYLKCLQCGRIIEIEARETGVIATGARRPKKTAAQIFLSPTRTPFVSLEGRWRPIQGGVDILSWASYSSSKASRAFLRRSLLRAFNISAYWCTASSCSRVWIEPGRRERTWDTALSGVYPACTK